jgi:hypothetical protein
MNFQNHVLFQVFILQRNTCSFIYIRQFYHVFFFQTEYVTKHGYAN